MLTEKIELINGYVATIAHDESAENPFTAWEGNAPLAVEGGRNYAANYGLTVQDVLDAITPEQWSNRAIKRGLLLAVEISVPRAAREIRDGAEFENLIYEAARDWQSNLPDLIAALCEAVGIPYCNTVSRGYSQGDWADVVAVALPAWVAATFGESPPSHDQLVETCKNDCELYGQWAWGDVYGVAAIHDADGREVEDADGREVKDASCWGFYGSDHAQSGLLEHCEGMVAYDLRAKAKEDAAAFDMACRDIVTA